MAKLAEVMKYTYDPADAQGKTELLTEIMQIHNLIELNRMRYAGGIHFNFEIRGEITDQRILRLILLTLAENIFKHGNLTIAGQPGRFMIDLNTNGLLRIRTRNLKNSLAKLNDGQHHGLSNIRTRLEYTYPGAHNFTILDEERTFEIILNIQL